MNLISTVFVIIKICQVYSDEYSRTIELTQGYVRGYKEISKNRIAFYSIPYASVPTGNDRFKAPLPAPHWNNTFEAVDQGIICPQAPRLIPASKIKNYKLKMTDNCLILNVFVPANEDIKLPVVVYIHGGAFQTGYGNMASHVPLTNSGKVIEVNFNYRLGAYGFLCLGTDTAPGNAGMKDQIAALRWVKQNIQRFGGDPENITLAGFSAGAAAAHLISLSEWSKGLYNKLILESGVAISHWSIQFDPLENAKKFAWSKNFKNIDDIYALEEFYKTTSLESLLSDDFMDRTDTLFFVPCIENNNKDSFLTEAPINLLKSGHFDNLPVLVGFGNMEGIYRLPLFIYWKFKMNEKFSEYLPSDLNFFSNYVKESVSNKIKEYYFSKKVINENTIANYVDFFSDTLFTYSILKAVHLHLENSGDSVYLYQYSYVDEDEEIPYSIRGANHCAQSMIISENIFENKEVRSSTYTKVQKTMSDFWVKFITTGQPSDKADNTSNWPPTLIEDPIYMEINEDLELKKNLLQDRYGFWEEIYTNHLKIPKSPLEVTETVKDEL